MNQRDGTTFAEADLLLLEALAASVAVAIENARLYDDLKASEERLRAQVGALRRDLARRERFGEIVGTSPAMARGLPADGERRRVADRRPDRGRDRHRQGARRARHPRASPRADGPFVAVNCAALPEALLESELFGHAAARSRARRQDHRGLFEAADGGTLFLDEIGEMPLALQAKLLRVLQEGEIVPVGDTRPRRIDVRVVSATNRDLRRRSPKQTFRQDLYYRLAAFPIRVPPLRERRDDIPLLAHHFLRAAAERQARRVEGIDPEALDALGPVRLARQRPRARRTRSSAPRARARRRPHRPRASLRQAPAPRRASAATALPLDDRPLREARAAFEARHIAGVLERHDGNVSHAAQVLGLSRAMLQRKMKDFGLR